MCEENTTAMSETAKFTTATMTEFTIDRSSARLRQPLTYGTYCTRRIAAHRITETSTREKENRRERNTANTSPAEPQVFPHQGQAGQGPEVQPPHSSMDPSPYRKHDQVNPPHYAPSPPPPISETPLQTKTMEEGLVVGGEMEEMG